MAARKFNPGQMGLFRPESDWTPPTELPDLRRHTLVACDTETRDDGIANARGPGWPLGPMGYLCGLVYATEDRAGYFPVRHPETECFPTENVVRWYDDHVRAGVRFVFHNAGYDLGWMGASGSETCETIQLEDTLAACVMLDENRRGNRPYSLDNCCRWQGVPGKDEELLRDAVRAYGGDPQSPQAHLWRLPARYAGPYAEADGRATLALWRQVEPQLRAQDVFDAYRTEADLIPMVVAMRRRGIRLDVDGAVRTRTEFYAERDRLLKELTDAVPGRRRLLTVEDLRSPETLKALLAAEGVHSPTKTASGKRESYSVDWMAKHPHWMPRAVTEILKFEEAATKFIDNYLLSFAHRGRVHAEVHQFKSDDGGTKSHRFSYSEPPLQQMTSPDKDPTDENKVLIERTAVGTKLRRLLLPERGELWAACDYCHDDQTEILTEKGWILFKDLPRDVRVAQYKSGALEWVLPTDYYVGPARPRKMVQYIGPKAINFCVTPEHEMILKTWRGEERVPAQLLPEHVTTEMLPEHGLLEGGDDCVPEDLLRLVVALQADAADRGGTFRFRLSKPRKLQRLLEILQRLGVKCSISGRVGKSGKTDVTVWPPDSVKQYLGPGKVFNFGALCKLSVRLRNLFLEELQHWDGKNRNGGISFHYSSTTIENVDKCHALAVLTNRQSAAKHSKKFDNRKLHKSINIRNGPRVHVMRARRQIVDYTGHVYCVTVPTHAIVTRRDGIVLISGQSQQEPRMAVHFASACRAAGAEAAVRQYEENANTDFHTMVAEMTGIPRPRAKILNLALMYGRGVASTATELGVSFEEAQEFFDTYHGRMPFVKSLQEICKRRASERGFIRLLDGARMHYDEWEGPFLDAEVRAAAAKAGHKLNSCSLEEARARAADPDHPWSRGRLRRANARDALNNLVQGSSARQTKIAMLTAWREGILPLIQMHDEIGSSVDSPERVARIATIMRDAVKLRVPMKVDAEVGHTWGTAKMPSFEAAEAKYGRAT